MRQRLHGFALGTAVVAVLGMAAVAALLGRAVAVPGSAIEDGMEGTKIGLPIVIDGRAFVEVPFLYNASSAPITIRAARPMGDPAGVRFVDLRVYDIADFDGSGLVSWSSSEGGAMRMYDPAKRRSRSVIGLTIPPKGSAAARPQQFILMELNAVELGVWRWPGTEIEYEQNGIAFKQRIGPRYVLEVAKNEAELERLYGTNS